MIKKLLYALNIFSLPRIVLQNKFLLWQFVGRNVSVRYKGALFGMVWSFFQPLLMLCVYTFVFSIIFKARWGTDIGDSQTAFALIMFCGMAVYNIFSESVALSVGVITGNPNLVKKVIFPLELLPLAQVISSTILSVPWFLLLILGTVIIFGQIHLTVLLLPVVLLPVVFVALGASYLVASLGVFFRDMQYIVGVFLQILFFLTPIFYPISAIPEKYRWILEGNPMSFIIEYCRNVLIFGKMPVWGNYGLALLLSLLALQFGFFWFHKTKKGFADVL